jgi:hypothetical protein
VCACVTDCNSETTSLLNTAVKVGENVTMHCSTINSSYEVLWLVYNPDKKIMSGAKAEFPRHFLTSDSSNPSLRALSIISTQLTDAGHYKCVEIGILSSSSAELLVLGE